jgi:uncharacterized cofD-like protein
MIQDDVRQRGLRLVRWFYPGLGVKRWLFCSVLGAMFFVNGLTRYLTGEGIVIPINERIDSVVTDYFSPTLLAPLFFLIGAIMVVIGIREWTRAIVAAVMPYGGDKIVDALFEKRKRHGYKIVVIGGGTGLSTMLRGLKRYTSNITAVVTVADDGGSSGRLQKELGVLPPGDIRNCLVALANDEALVTSLFQYRFSEGEGLSGHSFGNLFLAAMTGITGNFDDAIRESSRVLNIIGRVLPSTLAPVTLCAQLADGTHIQGESKISLAKNAIEKVYFEPASAPPLPEVLEAIRDADAIVLGPGSLYTSILPNLLVDDLVEAVTSASALKIYICNVMTQPGETHGFTASEHVRALQKATSPKICDTVVVNNEPPTRLVARYAEEQQEPVEVDYDQLEALGVKVKSAPVISETINVRHDPTRLANVIMALVEERVRARASYVRGERLQESPA